MILDKIISLLAKELPRAEKAKAIAEAIRAFGNYRWTGLYDVDTERGLVSNIAWNGSGAPEYPVFSITKGLTSRAIRTKKTVNAVMSHRMRTISQHWRRPVRKVRLTLAEEECRVHPSCFDFAAYSE